jgi:stearoyl-CoA 9-desaturase NADPH oxidoreductase
MDIRAMNGGLSAMFECARRPLGPLLRTRLVAAMTSPRNIDDYLEIVDSAWSVHGVRARVVALRDEAGDAVSLFLRPNELWRGFRAGQHVQLSVSNAGIRATRCFSLSSAPEDHGPLRVTIRIAPKGAISQWVRNEAHVGSVVSLSQAMGSFVLPEPVPPRLLFISGGSGITPVLSMIRHLIATDYGGCIAWLHYARREVILGSEQPSLAARCTRLQFRTHFTDGPRGAGTRFSREQLESFVPRWAESYSFLCGPPSLNEAVAALWTAAGLQNRLRTEHFTLPPTGPCLPNDLDDPTRHSLFFVRSGRTVEGRAGASLLEQAEGAGLNPPYGCRRGICHTCTCRKLSGIVVNELTGAVSRKPNEDIQLCVSAPRSDVSVDL